jgi:GAF domain-containing protein
MLELPPRTVQVIVDAAVDATGAAVGWLAVIDGDHLEVAGASAQDATTAAALVGRRIAAGVGTAGFVVQSGQPVALRPGTGGAGDQAGAALIGREPTSLVCVPCSGSGDAVGVLQVVDKFGGEAFDFDDIEVLTLLGTIGGAAIADAGGDAAYIPAPARIAADLDNLATADPERYAAVAGMISSLLRLA